MKYSITLLIVLLVSVGPIWSQSTGSSEADRIRQERERERLRRVEERRIQDSQRQLEALARIANGQNNIEKRRRLIVELSIEKNLSVQDQAKVSPSREDYEKYADFLKGKYTGLVKILLDPKCGTSLVVDLNDERCAGVYPLKGNGAYYSFRRGSHAESDASDIYYADGVFQVGFKKQLLGILIDLGDLNLDQLDKKHSAVGSLKDFKVPKNYEKLEILKSGLKKGMIQNQATYFDNLRAKPNTTYLFRTIAYNFDEQASNDNRIDAVIVFRVVKLEDESVTILWKGLTWKRSDLLKK